VTLEVNGRKKFGKFTSIWKLNNTLLNNQWVKEEIKREIRKYFEMNENENTTYHSVWDVADNSAYREIYSYKCLY